MQRTTWKKQYYELANPIRQNTHTKLTDMRTKKYISVKSIIKNITPYQSCFFNWYGPLWYQYIGFNWYENVSEKYFDWYQP